MPRSSRKGLRDEIFGQAANGYQRRKLAPILDAHLAASGTGITRHAVAQQEVYSRGVAASAIETSRAEAVADPALMDNAVFRAEGAARTQHAGQPPEAVESGVRAAGGSVIAGVIEDRLSRDDPQGVVLFRRYTDRLDPDTRHALGTAAGTLSNAIDAAAWLRDRSATLSTPEPTGDGALDAVNAASASRAEPPSVTSSAGTLLDQDGIVGTRERLAEIEGRRRALTALNKSEFAADPARLRANQAAIDTDTVRRRAAVKADVDGLHGALRRHLTTGGPNGGPAVTPPPATIMSRLTDAQQEAVRAQVDAAIEGRTTDTDPQTWYAIRQGLTADDAGERQRWASASLVPFMGRLSAEDYAALETLQSAVRRNDDGAGRRRLQVVARMANGALRSIGIDPTPRPDAASGSDAAQAAMFHRAVQDELAAFESRGRPPTETEAYGIVTGLKDAGLAGGWLEVRDTSPTVMSDIPPTDDALHQPGAQLAQTGPASQPGQGPRLSIGIDFDRLRQLREEDEQQAADGQATTGGSGGAPATEPDPGSPEYRAADAQARQIVAGQHGDTAEPGRVETARPPVSREASVAVPGAPALAPAGAVLGEIGQAALEAARQGAGLLVRVAPVAAGVAAAAPVILLPGNSGAELHPMGENLRVRTAPGQRSATVQRRIDDGLFGTGVGAKWTDLPVRAEWAYDEQTRRRYIAIDRHGLEQAIGRAAADAALGGSGIAMARPPSKDDPGERDTPGPGHNSESFNEKLPPELATRSRSRRSIRRRSRCRQSMCLTGFDTASICTLVIDCADGITSSKSTSIRRKEERASSRSVRRSCARSCRRAKLSAPQ
jgi:hypothetical protein